MIILKIFYPFGEDFCSLVANEGERKVFRFLREVVWPDLEFIGWYEPAIGEQGLEPGFVLFGNHEGLLVLEVKDWRIDQIEEELSSRNALELETLFHHGTTEGTEHGLFYEET